MHRRTFLRGAAAVTGVTVAGCLGDGGNPDTVLAPPDREYDVDPEDLAYPAYGQELPSATIPAPLKDREVTTTEFVGERESLVTFVYTNCPGPCPSLTASLAYVQEGAQDGGYADEVALMPISFDPEHDTTERIREFSEVNGADPTADNWFFLRPDSRERVEALVDETFGMATQRATPDGDGHSGHGENGSEYGTVLDSEDNVVYVHSNLLLLVNRDGYVERAYTPQPPVPDTVLSDLEAVRDGY